MQPLKIYPHEILPDPTTWIVIADDKHANIYSCCDMQGTTMLVPVEGTINQHPHSFVMHRPDTDEIFKEVSAKTHNAHIHDICTKESYECFLQELSTRLKKARQKLFFDQLILIAPPKLLHDLRLALDEETKHDVVAEVSKEHTTGQLDSVCKYLKKRDLI